MVFRKLQHSLRVVLSAIFLIAWLAPALLQAAETPDEDTLDLFTAWREETASATRSPKPLSQTAENVSVVTAREIKALNAHTLADVLDLVPGLQLSHNGGPGIVAYPMIQGASFEHVLLLLDGIPLTNVGSNFSDVSTIPARIIERVEIVKGPASTAWGSALGGVINVITKSPERERAVSGTATASIGDRSTSDSSLELSGSSNRLGYYLSAGFLGSDGLVPFTSINSSTYHGRLTWDLPNQGQLYTQFNGTFSRQGDLYVPSYDLTQQDDKRLLNVLVGLRQPLTERLELAISGYHTFLRQESAYYNISDGVVWWGQSPDLPKAFATESSLGGTASLTWRGEQQLLVLGADYRHLEITSNSVDTYTYSPYSRQANRWGLFLNDTITLGSVSITPGVRLDHPQTAPHQFSASLGATWQVTDNTLLRAYLARGYGMPVLTPQYDPRPTKILSAQIGAENTSIPYLWLKASLFRNMTWGADTEQQLAQGTELEVKTKPVFHTALGAGWTYADTHRTSDGATVHGDKPTQTLKLSLSYDDSIFRGMLTGRHIFWNNAPDDHGKNGLIWDLHLGATLFQHENTALELFFSGRNLFNSRYYSRDVFPNVGRWFEGGLRVKF
ncbi:TonB-dependent receptor [Trichlorobacter lovleyi]|uniref:TonB-dependent receptor plug domain-containing protein n=1 Tax=Trichlorobacter lovleyi TaxID=313985 RepID=UPI00223E9C40|nr:TonB-dependent receptor [Trichlorobacter lovleyi]QOX77799.1 TonB-dependent receptor [Trichlorobacter lovleyi]